MQMTKNGTGMYYKPWLQLNEDSQIIADIGFHFDPPAETMSYYGKRYKNRTIFMQLLSGYRKELLKARLVGTFHPVIIFQGGSSIELNKLSWSNMDDWIFIYAVGTGFQFYNGRILNEMLLKLNIYYIQD